MVLQYFASLLQPLNQHGYIQNQLPEQQWIIQFKNDYTYFVYTSKHFWCAHVCRLFRRRVITCMPQRRTPIEEEVLCWHLRIWFAFFSSEASSPCWRVPIFRSRTHGTRYRHVRFSSRINSKRGQESRRKYYYTVEYLIV